MVRINLCVNVERFDVDWYTATAVFDALNQWRNKRIEWNRIESIKSNGRTFNKHKHTHKTHNTHTQHTYTTHIDKTYSEATLIGPTKSIVH